MSMTMTFKSGWGIIFTLLSGLFSAVNFTFIIGMQPNPGDRLYVLILQMPTLASYSLSSLRFRLSSEDDGSTPSPIRRCGGEAL
ncbi:hypothetical protein M405DRAFT_178373 [Rhizopogon salebrosus TDB-379]|nr:hypothetical protein M405DRAFT_178373 [Rhizopogon salebrosus TDB-379]